MTETLEYQVKTNVFEGPLDLLLRLIKERKLFINEISLSQVTDDYIAFIKNKPKFNLAQSSGFLVIAATLILIKSKSLIPNISLSDDEEEEIGDLEARLKAYQVIKEISCEIKRKFGKEIIFPAGERKTVPFFSPDPSLTKESLLEAINNILEAMPKKEFLPEVEVKKAVSIEEMINSLIDRVQNNFKLSFSEFSKSRNANTLKEEKINVIVSFLAMLELVRLGIVEVIQNKYFEDITIEKVNQVN